MGDRFGPNQFLNLWPCLRLRAVFAGENVAVEGRVEL